MSVADRKVLTSSVPKRLTNLPKAVLDAAAVSGTSPYRILADLLRVRFGRQRLTYADYMGFGLFRKSLSPEVRREFVGDREALALNEALMGSVGKTQAGVIADKILTGLLLKGAGLPQAETLAVARATPITLPWQQLHGADQIADFLRESVTYPIFGKPIDSSRSLGAASLVALEGETLVLGDGTKTGLRTLATEIARDYPKGYLLQSLLRPHPDMERLLGPVVGTLRIVTLLGDGGPELLYAVQKMPGPGAMVDGGASGKNGMALVDLASGTLIRAQVASNTGGTDLQTNPITGATLPGAVLPDWDRAVAVALAAHSLLSQIGLIGVDVILSDKGPVITELNANPLASLYQRAADRGILNGAFKARFRKALQLQNVSLPVKGVRL